MAFGKCSVIQMGSAIGLAPDKKYEILEKIGSGSSGTVYKVNKLNDSKILALKIIPKNNSKNLDQFIDKELEILRLKSEYLIDYVDSFDLTIFKTDCKLILTEFCSDGDLRKQINNKISSKETFAFQTISDWSVELINGINFLHENNTIHRDIKPENILLLNGHLKIADFGLAKTIANNDVSMSGAAGTEDYMSPEILQGRKFNATTDIWSAGCVIFELISLIKFSKYIIELELEKNTIEQVKVPKQFETLTKMMLERDKNSRATSKELRYIIDSFIKDPLLAEINYPDWPINFRQLPSSQLEPRKENFIGREQVLKQIEQSFEMNKKVIISSLSGLGKSTVANEFAHRFIKQSTNNHVYWINASSNVINAKLKSLNDSFSNFTSERSPIQNTLNNLNEKTKILFIFDNCEDFKRVSSFINDCNKSALFLITTTNSHFLNDFKSQFESIQLESFNEKECFSYCESNFLKYKPEVLMTFLARTGENLNEISPYVLSEIGAFIKSNQEKQLEELCLKASDLKAKLYENLIEQNAKAWQILEYCSFLDCDLIPIKILLEILKILKEESDSKESIDLKKTLEATKLDLTERLNTLKSLGMITQIPQKQEQCVKLHRILKNDITLYLKSNETHLNMLKQKFIPVLDYLFRGNNDFSFLKSKIFYGNIKKIGTLVLDIFDQLSDEYANNCFRMAEFYSKWENYDESLALYEKLLLYIENKLEQPDKSHEAEILLYKLKVFNQIIDIQFNQGDYDLCLKNYLYLSENLSKIFEASETVIIADIYHKIGRINSKRGKYDLALDYLNKSLAIKRKKLPFEEHYSIAKTLTEIGSVYKYLAKYELSLKNLEESVEIKRSLSQKDDKELTNELIEIAGVNKALGQYDQGLESYEKVRKIIRNSFGDKNTSFAAVTNLIALVHKEKRNFKMALDFHLEALAIFKSLSNKKQKEDAAALNNNIGEIYNNLENYDQALIYYELALRTYESLNNDSLNSEISFVLNNLGTLNVSLGNYDLALKQYQKSLEMKKRLFNTDEHNIIAGIYNNIGEAYMRKKDYDSALVNYQESLRILKKVFSNDHISIADTLSNIGLMHSEKYDFKLAKDCFDEAIRIFRQFNTTKIGMAFNNMAEMYIRQGEFGLALNACDEAFHQFKEKINDPYVTRIIAQEGFIYHSQGFFDKALKSYEKALNHNRINYPEDNNVTAAKLLKDIGAAYSGKDDHKNAILNLEKSLAIFKTSIKGDNYVDLADALNLLALCHLDNKNFTESLRLFTQGLEIYSKLYPRNNSEKVAITWAHIAVCYEAQEKVDLAISACIEAQTIFESINSNGQYSEKIADLAKATSFLLHYNNNLSLSLEFLEKAFKLNQTLKRESVTAELGLSISEIYFKTKEHRLSIHYLKKSLIIYQKLNQFKSIVGVYFNMGLNYKELKDYENALKYFQDALASREDFDVKMRLIILDKVSNICNLIDRYDQALEYLNGLLELYRKKFNNDDNHIETARTLYNIALVHYNRHLSDDNAFDYFKLSFKIYENIYGEKSSILAKIKNDIAFVYDKEKHDLIKN